MVSLKLPQKYDQGVQFKLLQPHIKFHLYQFLSEQVETVLIFLVSLKLTQK